jgi:hypothetical protein
MRPVIKNIETVVACSDGTLIIFRHLKEQVAFLPFRYIHEDNMDRRETEEVEIEYLSYYGCLQASRFCI